MSPPSSDLSNGLQLRVRRQRPRCSGRHSLQRRGSECQSGTSRKSKRRLDACPTKQRASDLNCPDATADCKLGGGRSATNSTTDTVPVAMAAAVPITIQPLASATIRTRERARQRLLRRWPRQPQHRTWQRQRRLDGLSAAQSWLVKLATRQRTDRSKRPSRIKTPKCQVIRVVEILLDTLA